MRVITFLTLIILGINVSVSETIYVAIGDTKPYVNIENNKLSVVNPGAIVEITESVASALKWDLQYQILPFTRQLKSLENGDSHMILALLKAPNRDLEYSKLALAASKLCIYKTESDTTIIRDTDDLMQKRLGIVNGYSYGKLDAYIDEYSETSKIVRVSGEDGKVFKKLSKLLVKGRIDLFVASQNIFDHFNLHNDFTSIVSAGCVDSLYAYAAFSKQHVSSKRWVNQFDNEMAKFQKTPEFQAILNKYNIQNWVLDKNESNLH